MKLKKMLLGTLAGAVLLLAACGGNKTTTTEPQVPSTPSVSTNDSQPAVTNMLDGVVANGKVRVDIMNDNLGVRFAYGNQAIVSNQEMTYNASNTLTVSGTATADINFIFVVEKTDGTQVLYHPAIDKEQVVDFLADVKFEGALRVYVAISAGTVNWTKGLNTALDTKLNSYK